MHPRPAAGSMSHCHGITQRPATHHTRCQKDTCTPPVYMVGQPCPAQLQTPCWAMHPVYSHSRRRVRCPQPALHWHVLTQRSKVKQHQGDSPLRVMGLRISGTLVVAH
jgi:hypothetical protein